MTLRKFQEPRLTTKEKRCLTYLANKSDDGNTPLLVVELASNIQQRIVTLFEHLDAQIPPIYQRNFIYNMPWALEICINDTHLIYLRIMKEDENVFVSVIWMPRDEFWCAYFPA